MQMVVSVSVQPAMAPLPVHTGGVPTAARPVPPEPGGADHVCGTGNSFTSSMSQCPVAPEPGGTDHVSGTIHGLPFPGTEAVMHCCQGLWPVLDFIFNCLSGGHFFLVGERTYLVTPKKLDIFLQCKLESNWPKAELYSSAFVASLFWTFLTILNFFIFFSDFWLEWWMMDKLGTNVIVKSAFRLQKSLVYLLWNNYWP